MTDPENPESTGHSAIPTDAELDALLESETVSRLGACLTPVDPPPALRDALLKQIATTAQEGRLGRASGPPDLVAVEAADERRSAVAPWRRRRWLAASLRAAAALILVGTGAVLGRWSAMDSMAPTEHFAHLNQAQDVQRVSDTMPDGHVATLTWSQDMGMTALSLPAEMSAAAEGSSLQVWLQDGETLTSLGVYDPQSGTTFSFLTMMPQAGQQILITLEPLGGSKQPTSTPLVVLRVTGDSAPAGTGTAPSSPSSPKTRT